MAVSVSVIARSRCKTPPDWSAAAVRPATPRPGLRGPGLPASADERREENLSRSFLKLKAPFQAIRKSSEL